VKYMVSEQQSLLNIEVGDTADRVELCIEDFLTDLTSEMCSWDKSEDKAQDYVHDQ